MDQVPFSAWVAFVGLLFTIIMASGGIIWTLVWKLSDIQDKLKEYVDERYKEAEKNHGEKLVSLRTELLNSDASVMKGAAEVSYVFTSKVQQLEIYIRDQLKDYVLKEDFREDLSTITRIIDTLGTRIEKRLESLDEKLERLQDFNMNIPHREHV